MHLYHCFYRISSLIVEDDSEIDFQRRSSKITKFYFKRNRLDLLPNALQTQLIRLVGAVGIVCNSSFLTFTFNEMSSQKYSNSFIVK